MRGQADIPQILSQNGRNDLEGSGQWPPFSTPSKRIPEYVLGANLMIVTQIYDELSHGQAEFPRNLSQKSKMTLKVKDNDLHFQYHPRVSQDACLVQIWWF